MLKWIKKHDLITYFYMLVIGIVMIYGFNILTGYPHTNTRWSITRAVDQQFADQHLLYYDKGNVTIREKIKIDNQLIVYFEFNDGNGLGWLEFEKGLFFNYRLNRMVYSLEDHSHFDSIINTKDGKYLMIMGENKEEYDQITFTFNSNNYMRDIDSGKYYIIYMKIPDDTSEYLIATEITLTNKKVL